MAFVQFDLLENTDPLGFCLVSATKTHAVSKYTFVKSLINRELFGGERGIRRVAGD